MINIINTNPAACWLLIQATGSQGQGVETDFISLFASMGIVAYAILVVLVFFSIGSWAIIFEKWRLISQAKQKSVQFLELFRRSSRFSEVQKQCQTLSKSPLVGLFLAGYSELRYQLNVSQSQRAEVSKNFPMNDTKGQARIHNLEGINRSLQRASSVEINKLDRSINFLATTAGVCPFIGLFGTVWGVITAFQKIGGQGSTSLATVAPGIAEALIITAAGLFAAIPALIGYNSLLNKIKILESEMDDFSLEFISVTERSFMDNAPSASGTLG